MPRPFPHVRLGEVGHLRPEEHVVQLGLPPVIDHDPDGRDVDPGDGGSQLWSCHRTAGQDEVADVPFVLSVQS
jgi:hypothetical protein